MEQNIEQLMALKALHEYPEDNGQEAALLSRRMWKGQTFDDLIVRQNDCWNHSHLIARPRVLLDGRRANLSLAAWALASGQWPNLGIRIKRLCCNPLCFNPQHMYEEGPLADPKHLTMACAALGIPDRAHASKGKQKRLPHSQRPKGALAMAREEIALLQSENDSLIETILELQEKLDDLTD